MHNYSILEKCKQYCGVAWQESIKINKNIKGYGKNFMVNTINNKRTNKFGCEGVGKHIMFNMNNIQNCGDYAWGLYKKTGVNTK